MKSVADVSTNMILAIIVFLAVSGNIYLFVNVID